MSVDKKIQLWKDRMFETRKALSNLYDAMGNLSMFPAYHLELNRMCHKLNDYILTCYEEIEKLDGDPYNIGE